MDGPRLALAMLFSLILSILFFHALVTVAVDEGSHDCHSTSPRSFLYMESL